MQNNIYTQCKEKYNENKHKQNETKHIFTHTSNILNVFHILYNKLAPKSKYIQHTTHHTPRKTRERIIKERDKHTNTYTQ